MVRIDEMAHQVGAEIRRNYHRFLANPSEADHSQAKYCALMMVTVLQQDFGVRYNPERIRNPDFRNAGDLFIHGILGGDGGTCASMPVLYTAVGRRLGWPMKLVHAHAHLFCRWDGLEGKHPFGEERFNLEATGRGANFFPDDYYRTWPAPVPDELIERLGYLKSLTPEEELADFLVMRGHCMEDNRWIGSACEAYRQSCRLAPRAPNYRAFWEHAELLRDRLREKQTLLDYYGPDVPLPFGYFQRHVLRQMASEMLSAENTYANRIHQMERERWELQRHAQTQEGQPTTGNLTRQFAVLLPNRTSMPSTPNAQPRLVGITPGASSPLGWISGNGETSSPFGINVGIMSAKLLRTIDPQRLAIRRREAAEITKSLPKEVPIRQPIRLLLTLPDRSQPKLPASQLET